MKTPIINSELLVQLINKLIKRGLKIKSSKSFLKNQIDLNEKNVF